MPDGARRDVAGPDVVPPDVVRPDVVRAAVRRRALGLLVVLLAVVVPLASVAGLTPQVVRTGSVSHWPWEEHGVLGWWLVPLGVWLAVVPALLRARPARADRLVVVLVVVAAATTLALLYNP